MRSPLALADRLLERLPVPRRFGRFLVVGASGTLVNLALLGLGMLALPLPEPWRHRLASGLAVGLSILWNFLLHDRWTWGDRWRPGRRAWLGRLLRFYAVAALAAAVQWLLAMLLYELWLEALLDELGVYVAQAGGILGALFLNFGLSHYWTFRAD